MRLLTLENDIPRINPSDGCSRSQEDSLSLEASSASIEDNATKTFHQLNHHQ